VYEAAIIGGGLAGLASAIHLARSGVRVVLFEQHDYPRNKVCGEYISNEVLPYLRSLDLDPAPLKPKAIRRLLFSAPSGRAAITGLPLGGFSVRRYTLDQHWYEAALAAGVEIHLQTPVVEVEFAGDAFSLRTRQGNCFEARVVLGSYGKRSLLDRVLQRRFFQEKARYIGVKAYYAFDFPEDLVALHNFPGGYCGLSQVENGLVNVAYLTTHALLQRHGSIEELEKQALGANPFLRELLEKGERVTPRPWVISNVSFRSKALIEDHVLMNGDAAGMIPPLAGNGMAMAIGSAQIAAPLVLEYLSGRISRTLLERNYEQQWNHLFRNRLFWGRHIQAIMGKTLSAEIAVRGMHLLPGLLPVIIKQTHGVLQT
jgi:flavin-dependent dehydrogenase